LEEALPHVRGASKVSFAELEKHMLQWRNNLKKVVPSDMFLPVKNS